MIQVGIIGSAGYVAGELIRCLIHHPQVKIDFLYSHSQVEKQVDEIHQDVFHQPEMKFSKKINRDVDIVFLCLGHGNSTQFLLENSFSKNTKIIDLSNDFRLEEGAYFLNKLFVYGLVALNKNKISKTSYIANPGCFATAIQLGLLPLAAKGLLQNDVHVNAITGATGAGQSLLGSSHYSWRNNNVSIYKAFNHQHLDEIKESITKLQAGFKHNINFLPVRGNFTRGIFASMYTTSSLSENKLVKIYQDYYKDEPFTHVTKNPIHLKQVVNTNYGLIQIQKIDDKVLITTAIDNLIKGAAGQAIQNMNLMFDLEETAGLHFKANYF